MENAQAYFEEAKKMKSKREGAVKAMQELNYRIARLKAEAEKEENELKEKKALKKKREREWFEKFHYFHTSENKILVVSGRDAKQNDLLFSKYLHGKNLFFHAHIKGAAATIALQEESGKELSEREKLEVATFAACFSSAWKNNYSTIDVYALESDKVSKYESSGFVGKGGFALKGEREWFKDVKLQLFISIDEERQIPTITPFEGKNSLRIKPGNLKRSEVAWQVVKKCKVDKKLEKQSVDEIIQILPGECEPGK